MKKGLALLIILVLLFCSWQRNTVWLDEIALWSDVILKNPRETRAYYNIGVEYFRKGDYLKAIEYFKRTLTIGDSYDAAYNLGVIYGNMGDIDNAIIYFSMALEIKPDEEGFGRLILACQKKGYNETHIFDCINNPDISTKQLMGGRNRSLE